jgi:putative isomerase
MVLRKMIPDEMRRAKWYGGQLLAYSGMDGPTDYQNSLVARTAFGMPGIDIKLPGACLVRFPISVEGDYRILGDCFTLQTGDIQVQGAFIDAYHLLIAGPCEVLDRDPALSCHVENGRTLIGVTAYFDAAKIATDLDAAIRLRSHWLQSVNIPAWCSPTTRRTLYKAFSIMKTQVYSPEAGIRHRWTTPDCWPHHKMWLWDSVFHAIGWRHVDPQLAKDMITAVLDMQHEDGFIAHAMSPYDASPITQPPVLAFGVQLVNQVAPDAPWIEELYPKLCAYVEWDLTHRDTDGGGLLEWFIEGDPFCRSGESGMDNSPRFDTATQLDAVDFNSFLALECEVLAGFALLLHRPADASRWSARYRQLCSLIREKLWSPEQRFFVDYDVDKGQPSPVLASSGFMPLVCRAATAEQAAQLAAHVQDPDMFGTAFPVPCIAVRDTAHYAKDMWRGPTWININWLVAYGLERYGMPELAAKLRQQTARSIEKYYDQCGSLFECYDDRDEVAPPRLLRKGRCAPEVSPYHQVIHDYGWTATLYVDTILAQTGMANRS